ncbi:histidine kinase [Acidiferrobacter sp.]|uniref:histidine kinase n=1 Tax=Acidiferrobacter sp. TaxID=1872107 RepID=UPI002608BBD8|nr:histidine kinase [Acidiferrobacter sp.]
MEWSFWQRIGGREGRGGVDDTPPARGWARPRRLWLMWMAPMLLTGLLATAVVAVALDGGAYPVLTHDLALGALAAALVVAAVLWVTTVRSLWRPLAHLRCWAMRVRGGNLSARIPEDRAAGEFAELASDVNALGERLKTLTQERVEEGEDSRVIARWLGILNAITAGIASSQDLDELLPRFLFTLHNAGEVRGGIVRLLTGDGHLRLVASIGLPDAIVEQERRVALDCCLCGQAVGRRTLSVGQDLEACCTSWGQNPFPDEDLVLLAIPLRYDGRVVGLYNLFMERARVIGQNDVEDLLLGLGQHLGAAIEKMRLQDERRQLSLLQERMVIAHELHDSLAQTLASLRIQAQVLGETIEPDGYSATRTEFARLSAGLEIAHKEVRGLIRNFRAGGAEGGLLPALDAAIARFKEETGIPVYVQKDWHGTLPAAHETHVLRVIQEALANIRKHAHAQTVRVLLQSEAGGVYRVLIEDDGEGPVSAAERADRDDGHFGQTIMRERAHAIGGELRVEHEAGEGTRVWLTFPDPARATERAVTVAEVAR